MKKKYKNSFHYSYKGIPMRSSWEVNIARFMTFENIKFYYEPKRFDLKSGMSYLPDFYLPKQKIYIEVKGKLRTHDITRMKEFVKQGEELFLLRWQEYNKIIKGKLTIAEFLSQDMFRVH